MEFLFALLVVACFVSIRTEIWAVENVPLVNNQLWTHIGLENVNGEGMRCNYATARLGFHEGMLLLLLAQQ